MKHAPLLIFLFSFFIFSGLSARNIPSFSSTVENPDSVDNEAHLSASAASSVAGYGDEDSLKVTLLKEVEVTSHIGKYSKKNNPALELMRRIRKSRDLTDPRILPEYSEEFYTKTVYGLNNCRPEDFSGKDRMKFLNDYADTAAHTGLPVMLMSLREKAGTTFHSLNFLKDKMVVKAKRSVGVDDELAQSNIGKLLEDMLAESDIYSESITLLQQRFVSPLAHVGDDFYKYYIGDTVEIDGRPHIRLDFTPHNPKTFGFIGSIFVEEGDSTCFVRRVDMRVPRYVNLNYIDNIYITQEFFRDSYGKRHKITDDMSLELTVIPETPTLYVRRLSRRSTPQFNPDISLHNLLVGADSYIVYENANLQPWDKWNDFRMIPLSKAESGMGSMMTKLRRYPAIFWTEKILKILVTGYVATGKNSKVDIGPINTLVSYNSIEGLRLRLGGLTTANLSPHWFGRGYVAYGFHDNKLKYNAELEYSFVGKHYHSREFPINSIRLHYKYDLDQIGQHYMYTNSDNVFLSIKREKSMLALYHREAGVTYQIEWPNHFSVVGSFTHNIFEDTPWMPFVNALNQKTRSYIQAGFRLELRYAPGEKFYEGRSVRVPVNHDAPIVKLVQTYMPAKILGNTFCLNSTVLSMSKRWWFSAFGCADTILKFGKIWSQVQYPALLWQNANLSFTIQNESYSLMNPMEFPMDWFGSLDLTYFGNGILFNYIPWVNRLKLREVITFKGLMGGLTSKNDPDRNPNLYRFPENSATCRLNSTPYMELGVGIDNILTCIRLDYIWRLTYRHAPDAAKSGLRVSLHFSF